MFEPTEKRDDLPAPLVYSSLKSEAANEGENVTNPLVAHFGETLDFGPCLSGRNLNLLVFRGFANLDELAAISAPDVYDRYANPSGTQRELDPKHAASCYEYATSSGNVLPQDDPRSFPEIILNARDRQVVELYQVDDPDFLLDLDSFTSEPEFPGGMVGVRVRVSDIDFPQPTKSPQISRVDGNHRLSGVDLDDVLAGEGEPEDIAVAFCLYVGLNTEQEVKLFKDINGEHKGMDVTHLTNIEVRIDGDSLKTDPARRHKWMADRMAQPDGAFAGMVFFGGARAGAKAALGKVPPVKLNTLASTLKLQMSKATLVMANLQDKPDHVLELMNRYWFAVRKVFAAEWADRTNFILLQTIGLSGFAQLGATLMDMGYADKRVEQSDFEIYLQAVKKEVDLSRSAEQWKGVAGAGGANRVAEVLIKAATQDNITRTVIEIALRPETPDAGAQLD
jgi:DGQHR domain-containing protein